VNKKEIRAQNYAYPPFLISNTVVPSDLDRCLYLWHSEQVRGHIPVSDEMLKTEAIEFGNMLGLVSFKYSNGYLQKFKQRFSIYYYG
jgi:hypothetical protein